MSKEAGKASKLNNSKSRASGTGWLVVATGGKAKTSVHNDPKSTDIADSGKGSETVCFLGAQSDPRGFFAAESVEFISDKRLLRERGGEWVMPPSAEVAGMEDERDTSGVCSGENSLE